MHLRIHCNITHHVREGGKEREVYSKVPVNVQVCIGTILCVAAVASGVSEAQYNLLLYKWCV